MVAADRAGGERNRGGGPRRRAPRADRPDAAGLRAGVGWANGAAVPRAGGRVARQPRRRRGRDRRTRADARRVDLLLRRRLALVLVVRGVPRPCPRAARGGARPDRRRGPPPGRTGRGLMRICLVPQEYPPGYVGGIGTQTRVKARGLLAQGHEVEVLTAGEETGPALATRQDDGVTVHALRPPGGAFPMHTTEAYWLRYTWAVLAALRNPRERRAGGPVGFPHHAPGGPAHPPRPPRRAPTAGRGPPPQAPRTLSD